MAKFDSDNKQLIFIPYSELGRVTPQAKLPRISTGNPTHLYRLTNKKHNVTPPLILTQRYTRYGVPQPRLKIIPKEAIDYKVVSEGKTISTDLITGKGQTSVLVDTSSNCSDSVLNKTLGEDHSEEYTITTGSSSEISFNSSTTNGFEVGVEATVGFEGFGVSASVSVSASTSHESTTERGQTSTKTKDVAITKTATTSSQQEVTLQPGQSTKLVSMITRYSGVKIPLTNTIRISAKHNGLEPFTGRELYEKLFNGDIVLGDAYLLSIEKDYIKVLLKSYMKVSQLIVSNSTLEKGNQCPNSKKK